MKQATQIGMYDLIRWRPITPVQYVDEVGAAFLTMDEPSAITTKIEILPDGRQRLVTYAHVTSDNGEGGGVEPFIMVLFYPEASKDRPNLCFKRTDVELAL